MKAQILISAEDHKIICTSHCVGRIHDFQLYKDSCLPLDKDTLIIGDTGYMGIEKMHCKSLIPKKASKKHPLSKEDKYYNRIVSKMRIAVEHSIRFIKRFRMFSARYRSRLKTFEMRFNLICGICNFNSYF